MEQKYAFKFRKDEGIERSIAEQVAEFAGISKWQLAKTAVIEYSKRYLEMQNELFVKIEAYRQPGKEFADIFQELPLAARNEIDKISVDSKGIWFEGEKIFSWK